MVQISAMDNLLNPIVWLIFGGILVLAELIIPGGVIVFLGLAAIVVAVLVGIGLVTSWMTALTLFFILSLVLVISLRAFFMKYAGGDFSRGNIIEILDDVGEEAPVVEAIGPGQESGKINFRGTHWRALGDGSHIPVGEKVQIVGRDNVSYIVEAVVRDSKA